MEIFIRPRTALAPIKKPNSITGADGDLKGKIVLGIRLLFKKVKPGGTLDAKEAYAGEWIGTAPKGKPKTLGNDGRRVIGSHSFLAAVIQEFSLFVVDEKK